MPEPLNENNDNAPETGESPASRAAAPVKLRVTSALVIAAIYFVGVGIALNLPTVIGNAIGIVGMPALTAILLLLWWLLLSRIPWRDRFVGAAIYIAVFAWIWATQPNYRERIFLVALPIVNIGLVAIFAATMRSAWPAQRTKALLYLLACAVIFPMFRIDDTAGNLAPIMSWRWSPTADELLETAAGSDRPNERAELLAAPGPNDWPAFRGPQRDGVVRGTTIATNWSEKPPKEIWRKRVGLGFSAFAVVGDYIFTQEQRRDHEVVVCYKAATGDQVWTNAIEARFDEAVGSGPRATPAFDAGKLYTQGATGVLQCLDAATGERIWKTDVGADTGASTPEWGFSGSPLVTDKHVIVFTGGAKDSDQAVIAYDKATGTKAWCGGEHGAGYSSAQLSTLGGVPQVLVTSGFGVQAFEPATGAVLWQNEWKTKMNPRVVQPMVMDGRAVLVGTAEGKGTRYVQVAQTDAGWTATEKWTSREFRPYFNDFVLHRGYCYGFDGDTFMCVDANTGKRRWKGTKYGGQVLLVENSDALIVLSEKGEVALVRADPSQFQELAKFQAIEGKTWNHPVLANGRLFVRNAEEAACYEVQG